MQAAAVDYCRAEAGLEGAPVSASSFRADGGNPGPEVREILFQRRAGRNRS